VWTFVDVPLKPEVKAFIVMPPAPVSEKDNAYYDMIGFSAPSGIDIHAYGLKQYRTIMAEAEKAKNKKEAYKDQPEEPNTINFKGTFTKDERLLDLATKRSAELDKMLAENHELLARYRQLASTKGIAEPVDDSGPAEAMPIPKFNSIRSSHQLFLADQIRRAAKGDMTGALTMISKDTLFWRILLKQNRTFITKLISVACLSQNYQAVAELIGYKVPGSSEKAILATILAPLAAEELEMTLALQGEAQLIYRFIPNQRNTKFEITKHLSLSKILYSKNDTLNLTITPYIEAAKLSRLPSDRLQQEITNFQKIPPNSKPYLQPFNPIGKVLANIAAPDFSAHIYKPRNLEAKRRMVLIHLMAKEKGIKNKGMDQFVRQVGLEYANPYTNQPMQWDLKKNSIYIDALPLDDKADNKKEPRRVELLL
jgi:hypothetical protein